MKSAGRTIACFALAWATAQATGATLMPMGVLTPAPGGTTISWVSALSADGTYAVGYSAGPNLAGTATINQPVIWSQATGLVQLPNPADAGFAARGVVVRPHAGMIALAGSPTSGTVVMHTYQAPLGNPAGGNWSQTGYGNNATMGALGTQFNACRIDTSSGTADSWYIAGANSTINPSNGLRYGMDGAATAEYQSFRWAAGYYVAANAVSGNGYAAGSDRGNGVKKLRAVRLDMPGTGTDDPPITVQTVVPGGNRITSDALGISLNGLKLCGYDHDAGGRAKAFSWTVGDAGMTLLGEIAGDTASQALAINDAGLVGGFSSQGTTATMKAVLWDTTGIWDASGQPKLVTDLLAAAGVDTSAWSSLTRVTSISDDGFTIAGTGRWAADGTTRGWIAVVPEPATLLMLALSGLAVRRRPG